MTAVKLTGGGAFNPDDPFTYFVAGNSLEGYIYEHKPTLMAINDLDGGGIREFEDRLAVPGAKLFLDSGIFWLTQRHARAHDVHMDQALNLAPEEIDGWDHLYIAYLELVTKYEDRLWGYPELDQGGADRKRETRAKLEAEGLRPMPVYHPLNDGWDYFDELASQYDRICVGNIVQANQAVRKRILATIWERRRRYPTLRWVHLLGFTPNQVVNAYPPNSCDSSSWVYALRYGAASAPGSNAMNHSYGRFDRGYSYRTQTHADGEEWSESRWKAVTMLACQAHFHQEGWRRAYNDLAELLDLDGPWPAPLEGETITQGAAA